jgi:hypothetical protein
MKKDKEQEKIRLIDNPDINDKLLKIWKKIKKEKKI